MIKIKQFDFPTFEEWCEAHNHCVRKIGNYKVEIVGFFNNYTFFTDGFLMPHITFYPKDEVENINKFKEWYENGCKSINEYFTDYIRSYLIEED